jgi:NAD(P)-dependent dehydrogenase (short-subunit alcohol dehydrogenase family)
MSEGAFQGRVVIVTGAGHGIGRAIAAAFAAAGAAVVLADIDTDRAQEVGAELGRRFDARTLPVATDVRDSVSVAAMVERAVAACGQIDVLVNNAGIYPNTPVLDISEGEWDAVFDTNVKGMFLASQAVAQQMVKQGSGGRIVNISSGSATSGRRGAAHYCASKAAVNMLTRVLAIELAPHDIVVNAVAPGLIEVPDWSLREEYIKALVAATPLGRVGQPEDVARAVLYLASPQASYIAGTVLGVDGGSQAGRAVPLSG